MRTAVDEALNTIEQLVTDEVELSLEYVRQESKILSIHRIGAEVLDAKRSGVRSDRTAKRFVVIERLADLEAGIDEARRRRVDAVTAWYAAKAAEMRQERDERCVAADEHDERTRALLEALQEHEGIRYVRWEPQTRATLPEGVYVDLPFCIELPVSRSEKLRMEAQELEGQANVTEMERIDTSGKVKAESVADYIANLVDGLNDLRPSVPDLVRHLRSTSGDDWSRVAFVMDYNGGRVITMTATEALVTA